MEWKKNPFYHEIHCVSYYYIFINIKEEKFDCLYWKDHETTGLIWKILLAIEADIILEENWLLFTIKPGSMLLI